MEINKEELQTMMREFWAVDNNPNCLRATIIFLTNFGLSKKEIWYWLGIGRGAWDEKDYILTEEDREIYIQKVEETKDYFLME